MKRTGSTMHRILALTLAAGIFVAGMPLPAGARDAGEPEQEQLADVPESIPRLYEAVRSGDAVRLRAALDAGADLKNPACAVLLHTAVEFDNAEAIRVLLNAGAPANERPADYRGETALHLAVRKGDREIMGALLDGGALVNIRGDESCSDGLTPLQCTIESNDIESLNLMLERGADVNMQSYDGRTPLFIAVQQGRYRAASALIAAKARLQAGDSSGRTPLREAVSMAVDECRADAGEPNSPEKCPLCMIRLLARAGADINARSGDGSTPLHDAVYGKCLPMVKQLVEMGADVNARNDRGESPLYMAHRWDSPEIRDYLRSCGKRLAPDPELARYLREERLSEWERKQERIMDRALYLGAPLAYAACSIYLREFRYGGDPWNNPLAPVNGMASTVVLSAALGGLIGLLVGLPSDHGDTIAATGLTGLAIGILGGIYIGVRRFESIERSRILYYSGASLVFIVPLVKFYF
jgi:ankyrin repeat protein